MGSKSQQPKDHPAPRDHVLPQAQELTPKMSYFFKRTNITIFIRKFLMCEHWKEMLHANKITICMPKITTHLSLSWFLLYAADADTMRKNSFVTYPPFLPWLVFVHNQKLDSKIKWLIKNYLLIFRQTKKHGKNRVFKNMVMED